MADPNGSDGASRGGRVTWLWVGTLALSLGATAILVISDDPRLLRVGLVAALWAAFLGAFGVVRLRHRAADEQDRADQRREVYELELEREIAARREFELEAENEARRRATEETGDEIENLRAELRSLREVLEPLVGGNFLYERVALQAESTRVRSLSDQLPGGYGEPERGPGVPPPAVGATNGDRAGPGGPQRAPEPQRVAAHNGGQFAVNGSGAPVQGPEQGPARRGTVRGEHPGAPAPGAPEGAQRPAAAAAPPSPNNGGGPTAGNNGGSPATEVPADSAVPRTSAGGPLPDAVPGAPRPARPQPARPQPARSQQARPQQTPGANPAAPDPTPSRPDLTPAFAHGPSSSRSDLPAPETGRARPDPTRAGPGPGADRSSAPSGNPGVRDSGDVDGTTGSWTSQVSPGAHAEGTSVVDLLAAYGDSGDGRRRRRRGE